MVLHIGGNTVIHTKDIIGIFDIKTALKAPATQEFVTIAKEEGFLENISQNPPKSLILATVDSKTKIYLSPISSVTLFKRNKTGKVYLSDEEYNKGDMK
ncbi:MAG: extracellular matrix regulator RemB [Caldicoprobacterales bacterium]|jgi:hypothetical protein|nr:DUF370 domain-containing protein [Clostridiales bacterium]